MALDGTYSGLLASAADWLHRTDLAALLPDLVLLTEDAMNNGDPVQDIPSLRTSAQEVAWTTPCTSGSNYVVLPTNYVKMRQFYVIGPGNVKQELRRCAPIPLFQSDRAQIQGLPQWYFETEGQIYLIPQPYEGFALGGIYYSSIGPLVDTPTGNFVSINYPRIYLFGTCMFAAPWLGTDNRIQLWASGFKSGIAALNKMDKRKRISDELMRTELSDVMAPGPYNIYTGLYL